MRRSTTRVKLNMRRRRVANRNCPVVYVAYQENMQAKIRDLRQARGWSMRELARRVNTTSSTINKLEKGAIKIDVNWIKKLSEAFEVPMSELFGDLIGDKISFSSDVALYDGDLESAFPDIRFESNHSVYMVLTHALDQIGILPKHFLLVDQSIEDTKNLDTGDIVIFKLFDREIASEFATLMRQFVTPSIFITNTSSDEQQIINAKDKRFKILGVVTSHVSTRRRPSHIKAAAANS
jgi:transcriptional regulator with XRE-family HTH domain